ncbi:hypothetical protein [Verrucosispora sp. WMMC514]|uniref:hypothetical protein n=1 Tax=Verrucosispora sp. WMMC514 TaxID=3015156 RepID=UPI00248B4791|nr:hypothetical protein [Verrucosispora sp. WMMC514]WBB94201.1 hypothetical protein O7597_15230 [Verrucosispora sp. WMMC514]
MPASRAQRAATAERRAKAIAMRLAGLDYQTIADRLGYADRAAAHKDITRAMEASVQEMSRNADVLRMEELTRLDRLQAGAWTAAAAGDVKAIHVVLGIIDRRCKLLGLDAPVRHEVVTLGAIEQEIDRLNAELAQLDAGEVGEAAGTAPPA